MKTVVGKLSRGLQVRVLPGAPFYTWPKIIQKINGERSSVGRAPDCDSGGRGFEPHRSPQLLSDGVTAVEGKNGPLAQLAEQLTLNQLVVGSNPTRPTIFSLPALPPRQKNS